MKQQTVLLTGASAGIGKATAELLVKAGVIVYGASRSGSEGYENSTSGGKYIPVKMDVNQESQIKEVVDKIISDYGYLNVVIANAGNGVAGAIEETSIDEVRYQFETNFFGVVKTVQACIPIFRKQGYGKIITVSSLAGIIPIPFQTFYSSVKAALMLFMNGLSIELKPFGIQCCTILPGDTKTDFTGNRKYTETSQNEKSVYYNTMKKSVARMEKDEQKRNESLSCCQTNCSSGIEQKNAYILCYRTSESGILSSVQCFTHRFKVMDNSKIIRLNGV